MMVKLTQEISHLKQNEPSKAAQVNNFLLFFLFFNFDEAAEVVTQMYEGKIAKAKIAQAQEVEILQQRLKAEADREQKRLQTSIQDLEEQLNQIQNQNKELEAQKVNLVTEHQKTIQTLTEYYEGKITGPERIFFCYLCILFIFLFLLFLSFFLVSFLTFCFLSF